MRDASPILSLRVGSFSLLPSSRQAPRDLVGALSGSYFLNIAASCSRVRQIRAGCATRAGVHACMYALELAWKVLFWARSALNRSNRTAERAKA